MLLLFISNSSGQYIWWFSTSIVEPHNGLLSTHSLLDHTDVSRVLHNEACYEICQNKLGIKKPSYIDLNRIICKVISSRTGSSFWWWTERRHEWVPKQLGPFSHLFISWPLLWPQLIRRKSYDCAKRCQEHHRPLLTSKLFLGEIHWLRWCRRQVHGHFPVTPSASLFVQN